MTESLNFDRLMLMLLRPGRKRRRPHKAEVIRCPLLDPWERSFRKVPRPDCFWTGDSRVTRQDRLPAPLTDPSGVLATKRPTRPTGLGVLELSEAGSAWPSTAAPDRGL